MLSHGRHCSRTLPLVLTIVNLMSGLAVPSSTEIQSGVGEPTMVDAKKLSRNVLPFTVEPNTIEVLERLRDSYKRPLGQQALTGADRAVLVATGITLKRLARAS
jgi:hypothetical protein